jgi:hypothetical protein
MVAKLGWPWYREPNTYKRLSFPWIKRHLRKFGWCYLLAGIIIGVIAIVVMLYSMLNPANDRFVIAFPQIAQSTISGASIQISGISFEEPEEDSFFMRFQSQVVGTGVLTATLSPMTLNLSTSSGEVFANVSMPEFVSARSGRQVDLQQRVYIENKAAFESVALSMIQNSTVNLLLDGVTTLSAIGRSSPVTFQKNVTFPGYLSFCGLIQDWGVC